MSKFKNTHYAHPVSIRTAKECKYEYYCHFCKKHMQWAKYEDYRYYTDHIGKPLLYEDLTKRIIAAKLGKTHGYATRDIYE